MQTSILTFRDYFHYMFDSDLCDHEVTLRYNSCSTLPLALIDNVFLLLYLEYYKIPYLVLA